MAINFVSTMLGHTNLTTTSRYLNIHRRGLHPAMAKYEEPRPAMSEGALRLALIKRLAQDLEATESRGLP